VKKTDYYKVYPRTPDALTTWNSVDKEIHARKRRVLSNALSDKAMRNAEPFVQYHLDRWCELLDQNIDTGAEWSPSLNMAEWANHLVFDILGDLCFGKSFDMKESGIGLRFVPNLMINFMSTFHCVSSKLGPLAYFRPY
jgi:cytochrome P450